MRVAIFPLLVVILPILVNGCASKKETPPKPLQVPTPVQGQPHTSPAPVKEASEKKPVPQKQSMKYECKKDADQRSIEAVNKETGCEVKYSKGGKTSSVASSTHGMGHCQKVVDKMKANLQKAGYKCE